MTKKEMKRRAMKTGRKARKGIKTFGTNVLLPLAIKEGNELVVRIFDEKIAPIPYNKLNMERRKV